MPPPAPEKAAALPPEKKFTYTYIGQASHQDRTASRQDAGQPLAAAPLPKPAPAETTAQSDSSLHLHRREPVAPATGDIPDLDIDLAGNDIRRVMEQYGYVPAVKTRDRLLGKIVGRQFLPLQPEELARYARRGRSGAQFPQASRWLQRVAAELHLPHTELRLIFLVPHATERLFVAAEMQAIATANVPAAEIALVRAYFDSTLAIVVRQLVTKAGTTITMDSLRTPSQ
ncbi:MAG: hypothetical protein ONB44_24550 [candidate division KSB1 bacterium]|nr:hypothetical protein [candidate division KSB1 bacterium]